MSAVPTAVRKTWAVARKPASTSTIATQTDDIPVEQSTQTTVKEAEKVEQSTEDTMEDQYIVSTLVEIVGALMEHADDYDDSREWRDLVDKFRFVTDRMAARGFPMKLRRSRRLGGRRK
jgi:hypothetical protein